MEYPKRTKKFIIGSSVEDAPPQPLTQRVISNGASVLQGQPGEQVEESVQLDESLEASAPPIAPQSVSEPEKESEPENDSESESNLPIAPVSAQGAPPSALQITASPAKSNKKSWWNRFTSPISSKSPTSQQTRTAPPAQPRPAQQTRSPPTQKTPYNYNRSSNNPNNSFTASDAGWLGLGNIFSGGGKRTRSRLGRKHSKKRIKVSM